MKFGRYIILLLLLTLAVLAWRLLREKAPRSGGRVQIKKENGKYQLYKNGLPFFVKGGAGSTHMKELAAAGGNTIRTWDTTRLGEILDEAASHGLSVIAGFYLPASTQIAEFYEDSTKTGSMIRAYSELVDRYKKHPALLAWCLGNELKFSLLPYQKPFYKILRQLLTQLHEQDKDHPVTTTVIEKENILGIKLRVPDFDFISINTFANIKKLRKQLSNVSWFWNGPYMITEWAPVGGWEAETTAWQAPIENTSTKTAEQVSEYYKNYMPLDDGRLLGSLLFYWGSKEEYTHTWFSMFNENGTPTEVTEAISDCWKDTVTTHLSPIIEYILVDNKGARDNILMTAGSEHIARLVPRNQADTSTFRYHWEVIKEDWWGHLKKKQAKPMAEPGLFSDSLSNTIKFKAPLHEGPYRIFVTVRNNYGYSATANIPFYVASQ